MQGYKIIERRPEETVGRVVRYELTKRAAIMKANANGCRRDPGQEDPAVHRAPD